MKTPRVLVLGATGMVGQAVFSYLSSQWPKSVWGTARTSKQFFTLDTDNVSKQLEKIISQIGPLDLVINCVGKLRQSPETETVITEYIQTNSLFPHQLALLASKYEFRLLHISTDAVFSDTNKNVVENSPPHPEDTYGLSKLLGEPLSTQVLTIRTSFLGLDPIHHHGLLEWATNDEIQKIGYQNQLWSGCTTLQFANLTKKLANPTTFQKVRTNTSVLHFAPLSASKYKIVATIRKIFSLTTPIKGEAPNNITRRLFTRYTKLLPEMHESGTLLQELKRLMKDL